MIKDFMEAVNKHIDSNCKEAGQFSLKEIYNILDEIPDELPVIFDPDSCRYGEMSPDIDGFHSYRGYYHHIAIEPTDENVPTVEEFKEAINDAIHQTFEGYKGGFFQMNEDTPVWIAYIGDYPGIGITGIGNTDTDVELVLENVQEQI